MSLPGWLPELEELKAYGGDFSRYLDAIYEIFCADFVVSKPVFAGKRLGLKRHPVIQGKEANVLAHDFRGARRSGAPA